ncbi:MAG: metallophosphoesterase [Clostridia bacterium]|nr:metallophosphoesterase [Clostridia bacterium]
MKNKKKLLIIAGVLAVILLAAATVLVTVILPAMNEQARKEALEEAKAGYAAYLGDKDANEAELAIFVHEKLFVAIRAGEILDVFDSADQAAKALLDNPKSTEDESVGFRTGDVEGHDNLFLIFPAPTTAPTADTLGVRFTTEDACTVNRAFDVMPATFEAWVKIPKYLEGSAGVILGNYAENVFPCFTFNIGEGGSPSLYLAYENGKSAAATFNSVDLCTGEWVHVAIVNNPELGTATCYVNGKIADETDALQPIGKSGPARLGGDNRAYNRRVFRGELHSVAVYEDVRSMRDIHGDMQKLDTDGLLAAWTLSEMNENRTYTDISGNGYSVSWPQVWFEESAFDSDYDYTFVAIGDTQLTNVLDPENFQPIFDWIAENKDAQKIGYVMGMGDITDVDRDPEWNRAETGYGTIFDADIPCSILRGNHDSVAKFNRTFAKAPYTERLSGTYGEGVINTYRKINVRGIKYLIITMDFGARDDVLAWADEIISENPDFNVIITTHAYLYPDATPIKKGDKYAPTNSDPENNNGEDMWERLIKKHENIVLVLCGHESHPTIVTAQDKGEHGNVVTQMMTDQSCVDSNLIYAKQNAAGMLTLLHFSESGTKLTVECYSPIYDMYYRAENQFELTLDTVNK